MNKNSKKYFIFLALSIALVSFLIVLIFDYIIALGHFRIAYRILLDILEAISLGVLLSAGLFVFSPTLSDAMITLRRMLRYESLSNPLLLKLSTEAPGTYHHSLNVSVLASKAAKAVNADSLLVRIAAYYHDLGKLNDPFAFVENQAGIEVPTSEDEQSIKENAQKIIAHVKAGVLIAEENHLPKDIINMIEEHHGTTYALYFYAMAKERGLKVKKTDFKYAGPIPQSKESAILMLSDCVEAAARSMSNLTAERIEGIVKNIYIEKTAEKQFRDCNLTDKDFEIINSSLTETLQSIYHQRIEYK